MKKATAEGTWRESVADRCGGSNFDAPGGGYSFSAVLNEERVLEKENVTGAPGSALLRLSVADPTWKTERDAIETMMEYYEKSPDATRYTDNSGIPGTHEAICQFLNQKHETKIKVDNVQYSPGAIKRLLSEYIPSAFFDDSSVIVFPTPGYGVITSAINRRGSEVIDLPLTDGCTKIPYERLAFPVGFKKRFIYLNVPHNPSGLAWDSEEWKNFLCWLEENNVIAIVDEAYTDIRYGDSVSVLTIPGWSERCLVLQSISKGWSATGFRFGWVVGDKTAIAVLRKVMDVKDSGELGLTIAGALKCLDNPRWSLHTKEKYRNLHVILYRTLSKSGFEGSVPGAGLCQLTKAPKSADGHEFSSLEECVKWFREKLRISLMHYDVDGKWYLRWAVTIKPIPECGLPTEESVLEEVFRRFNNVEFGF